MVDWLELAHRRHTAYMLFEVDVTQVRQNIREYRASTGAPLSFNAFITACWARAIEENKFLHAFRKGRRRVVLFDDVDVTVAVERELDGEKIPAPLIIRAANQKSYGEIDREIKKAQTGDHPQSGAMAWLPWWLLLPAFIRRFIWKRWLSNPNRRKRLTGTTLVTNAGMFGSGTGWGISPPAHTAILLVGSIARKPGVVADQIRVREHLCLTIGVDHDIVDGAVAARFAQRLKDLIEEDQTAQCEPGVTPGSHRYGKRVGRERVSI